MELERRHPPNRISCLRQFEDDGLQLESCTENFIGTIPITYFGKKLIIIPDKLVTLAREPRFTSEGYYVCIPEKQLDSSTIDLFDYIHYKISKSCPDVTIKALFRSQPQGKDRYFTPYISNDFKCYSTNTKVDNNLSSLNEYFVDYRIAFRLEGLVARGIHDSWSLVIKVIQMDVIHIAPDDSVIVSKVFDELPNVGKQM